jgi:peptide/nickel transport system permease protein
VSQQAAATSPDRVTTRATDRRWRLSTIVSLVLLVGWIVVALLSPILLPQDPTEFITEDSYAWPPGAWLGADYLGRDLAARLIDGARLTLGMSFSAAVLAHLVGGGLGILAAIRGGAADMLLGRAVDVMLSLPKIIVGLVVIAALGPSVMVIVGMAGLVYASGVFRIARALATDVLVMDFVQAARARGEGTGWILFGEVLPNILRPLAADFALRLSFAILFISSLSFLGLGVQPPMADWGGLVRENISGIAAGSFAPVFPALAIASVTISLNLLVDAWSERQNDREAMRP